MKELYERIALLVKTLDALKVPHHGAPGEAEAECAKLQQEGLVDAVWSEDGDTLMFGCDYLLRTYREKNKNDAKSKTHVRVYRANEIRATTGLDQQGLILFALLSGGDYSNGPANCGARAALRAARQGFGRDLFRATTLLERDQWRHRLQELFKRRDICVPPDFPKELALKNYCQPKVSSATDLAIFFDKPTHQWGRPIDEEQLADLIAEQYNVCGALYVKHIDPIYFIRALAATRHEDRENNRCWDVRAVKTRKEVSTGPPVIKVRFRSRKTQLLATAQEPNTVDKADLIECEALESLLRRGVPEDMLDPSTQPKRTRKRKAAPDNEDDSTRTPKPIDESPNKRKRRRKSSTTTPSHRHESHPLFVSPSPNAATRVFHVSSEEEGDLPDLDTLVGPPKASVRKPRGTQTPSTSYPQPSASANPPSQTPHGLTNAATANATLEPPPLPSSDWQVSYTDDEDEETALKGAIKESLNGAQLLQSVLREEYKLTAAIVASLRDSSRADPGVRSRNNSGSSQNDDPDLEAAITASLQDRSEPSQGTQPWKPGEVIDLCDDD